MPLFSFRKKLARAEAEGKMNSARCPICGTSESLRRCSPCQRESYCSREHQRQHWKLHRADCSPRFKQKDSSSDSSDMVVVVEIKSGQGSGLANPMVNHLFDSQDQATEYIRERLGYIESAQPKKLTHMPFLTELLGFSSASLYVDPRWNAFAPFTQEFCHRHIFGLDLNEGCFCFGPHGTMELNAMAIFLGCRVDDGLSRFLNARGDAFFVGLTFSHQPVTSNVLWGVANLLCEVMQYYPDAELEGPRKETFRKWRREYSLGTWQPKAGNAGVNIYETDPFQSPVGWPVVDHRKRARSL